MGWFMDRFAELWQVVFGDELPEWDDEVYVPSPWILRFGELPVIPNGNPFGFGRFCVDTEAAVASEHA